MMIEAKATRRTSLNGKNYAKGSKVPMTQELFDALLPTGRFELVPARKKTAASKANPSPTAAKKKAASTKADPSSIAAKKAEVEQANTSSTAATT